MKAKAKKPAVPKPPQPVKPVVRPKPRTRLSEAQVQRTVCDWLAMCERMSLLTYCHVPNGYVSRKAGGIAKGLGMRAGVPDLIVWLRNGPVISIELKVGSRSLSEPQLHWHGMLRTLGHSVHTCKSLDSVIEVLVAAGLPRIGVLSPERRIAA
jgi:VRR-NUC domain